MKKNYYEVLEISYKATQAEIKESYRKLVKIYHPDANHDRDTTKEFQIISEAYTILSDPAKRREYDLSIRDFNSSNSYRQNTNTYSSNSYRQNTNTYSQQDTSYRNNNKNNYSKNKYNYKYRNFKYDESDLYNYYDVFLDLDFDPEQWLNDYLTYQSIKLEMAFGIFEKIRIKEETEETISKYNQIIELRKILRRAYAYRNNYRYNENNYYSDPNNQRTTSSTENTKNETKNKYAYIQFEYNFLDFSNFEDVFMDLDFDTNIWYEEYMKRQKNPSTKDPDMWITLDYYDYIQVKRKKKQERENQFQNNSRNNENNKYEHKNAGIQFKYNYTDFINYSYVFMDLDFDPNIWYDEYIKRQKNPSTKDPEMWKTLDYFDQMKVKRKKEQEKENNYNKRYYKKRP